MATPLFRRSLSRRRFLRGVGAALALPALDAMQPALAAASAPPRRYGFVFLPNGVDMTHWRPQGPGRQHRFSPALSALSAHRESVSLLSGLTLNGARALGDGPGDHARAAGSFLTTAHPYKTAGEDLKVGRSIDQRLAELVGTGTRFASLELGCEQGRAAGSCDSGYACAYSNNIAWRDEKTPVAKETDPRAVFDRLFGSGEDAAATARRRRQRRSILDLVGEQTQDLQRRLGAPDRDKLAQYLDAVRETEKRLEALPQEQPLDSRRPDRPDDYPEHLRSMYELMALAFQTDSTRVISFMVGNAGSNRSYGWLDVRGGHHELSHHRKEAPKVASIQKINRFHVEEFARFLDRMQSVDEDGGGLLDSSLVLMGSAISDGNRHNHDDLPMVLAGRGGGLVRGGAHLENPDETPLANLYLRLLHSEGLQAERFGDSTDSLDLRG